MVADLVDLLNTRRPVAILEDSFGITQLTGALEQEVTSAEGMLALIDTATAFRRTEATHKNDSSSRSHAICRIRIQNPGMPAAEDGVLYLIDLAGSEAARDTAAHDAQRMKETREINASLSVLKDCIRGKAEADAGAKGRKPHVPFRQSALTKVLKHVFDPAGMRTCKTVVVGCVNPCLADVGPSKNTLRYAETLRVLVPKSKGGKYDPKAPMTWSNEQAREWIEKNVSIVSFEERGYVLMVIVWHAAYIGCDTRPPGIRNATPPPARAGIRETVPPDTGRLGRTSESIPLQALATARRLPKGQSHTAPRHRWRRTQLRPHLQPRPGPALRRHPLYGAHPAGHGG